MARHDAASSFIRRFNAYNLPNFHSTSPSLRAQLESDQQNAKTGKKRVLSRYTDLSVIEDHYHVTEKRQKLNTAQLPDHLIQPIKRIRYPRISHSHRVPHDFSWPTIAAQKRKRVLQGDDEGDADDVYQLEATHYSRGAFKRLQLSPSRSVQRPAIATSQPTTPPASSADVVSASPVQQTTSLQPSDQQQIAASLTAQQHALPDCPTQPASQGYVAAPPQPLTASSPSQLPTVDFSSRPIPQAPSLQITSAPLPQPHVSFFPLMAAHSSLPALFQTKVQDGTMDDVDISLDEMDGLQATTTDSRVIDTEIELSDAAENITQEPLMMDGEIDLPDAEESTATPTLLITNGGSHSFQAAQPTPPAQYETYAVLNYPTPAISEEVNMQDAEQEVRRPLANITNKLARTRAQTRRQEKTAAKPSGITKGGAMKRRTTAHSASQKSGTACIDSNTSINGQDEPVDVSLVQPAIAAFNNLDAQEIGNAMLKHTTEIEAQTIEVGRISSATASAPKVQPVPSVDTSQSSHPDVLLDTQLHPVESSKRLLRKTAICDKLANPYTTVQPETTAAQNDRLDGPSSQVAANFTTHHTDKENQEPRLIWPPPLQLTAKSRKTSTAPKPSGIRKRRSVVTAMNKTDVKLEMSRFQGMFGHDSSSASFVLASCGSAAATCATPSTQLQQLEPEFAQEEAQRTVGYPSMPLPDANLGKPATESYAALYAALPSQKQECEQKEAQDEQQEAIPDTPNSGIMRSLRRRPDVTRLTSDKKGAGTISSRKLERTAIASATSKPSGVSKHKATSTAARTATREKKSSLIEAALDRSPTSTSGFVARPITSVSSEDIESLSEQFGNTKAKDKDDADNTQQANNRAEGGNTQQACTIQQEDLQITALFGDVGLEQRPLSVDDPSKEEIVLTNVTAGQKFGEILGLTDSPDGLDRRPGLCQMRTYESPGLRPSNYDILNALVQCLKLWGLADIATLYNDEQAEIAKKAFGVAKQYRRNEDFEHELGKRSTLLKQQKYLDDQYQTHEGPATAQALFSHLMISVLHGLNATNQQVWSAYPLMNCLWTMNEDAKRRKLRKNREFFHDLRELGAGKLVEDMVNGLLKVRTLFEWFREIRNTMDSEKLQFLRKHEALIDAITKEALERKAESGSDLALMSVRPIMEAVGNRGILYRRDECNPAALYSTIMQQIEPHGEYFNLYVENWQRDLQFEISATRDCGRCGPRQAISRVWSVNLPFREGELIGLEERLLNLVNEDTISGKEVGCATCPGTSPHLATRVRSLPKRMVLATQTVKQGTNRATTGVSFDVGLKEQVTILDPTTTENTLDYRVTGLITRQGKKNDKGCKWLAYTPSHDGTWWRYDNARVDRFDFSDIRRFYDRNEELTTIFLTEMKQPDDIGQEYYQT